MNGSLPNFGNTPSAPCVADVTTDAAFDVCAFVDCVDDFLSTLLLLELCDADDALLTADGVGLGIRLRS